MEKNISASSSQHNKQPFKRAFQGLAGSPLAKVRRGRPRKWASDAERKRAERNNAKQDAATVNIDATKEFWNKRLAKRNLSVNRGETIKKALKGKGLIIYGSEETARKPQQDGFTDALSVVFGEDINRHFNGRRATQTGAGHSIETRWTTETDDQFQNNHPYANNGQYGASPTNFKTVKAVACDQHSPRYRDSEGNEHAEPMKVVSRRKWVVTLECGCVRDVTPKRKKKSVEPILEVESE